MKKSNNKKQTNNTKSNNKNNNTTTKGVAVFVTISGIIITDPFEYDFE